MRNISRQGAMPLVLASCLFAGYVFAAGDWQKDDVYHDNTGINDYLELDLGPNNPTLVRTIPLLPKTVEGRQIRAVKISANVQETDDPTKPDILILAGLHAREWLAVEAARMTAKYLVESYKDDTKPDHDYVKYLLDHTEVWIVPVGNPDGNIWSHSDQEIAERRMWRKNRWKDTVGTVYGVDINRNFDEPNWGGTGNAEGWGRWGRN